MIVSEPGFYIGLLGLCSPGLRRVGVDPILALSGIFAGGDICFKGVPIAGFIEDGVFVVYPLPRLGFCLTKVTGDLFAEVSYEGFARGDL